jgi:hypothetical protein
MASSSIGVYQIDHLILPAAAAVAVHPRASNSASMVARDLVLNPVTLPPKEQAIVPAVRSTVNVPPAIVYRFVASATVRLRQGRLDKQTQHTQRLLQQQIPRKKTRYPSRHRLVE